MKRTTTAILLVLLTALCAFASDDIEKLLPKENLPEGWNLREEPMLFEGGALFRHINGGAEQFHEHGFIQLLVQDYKKGDLEVRVEIYDMATAGGADAIMEESTKGVEVTKDIGRATSLDAFQIIFVEGQYFVSLTNFNGSDEEFGAMKQLAPMVAKLIK